MTQLDGRCTAADGVHGTDAVDMELIVLAAQLDPVAVDAAASAASVASVTAVQRALADRGLLSQEAVGGRFDEATRQAYSAWQRSLGYWGIDANGLPGYDSLGELGKGHFSVTHVIDPGRRTTFDGFAFNTRTVEMLREAYRLAEVTPAVGQGSYADCLDPASVSTHEGGGAVDLVAEELTDEQRARLLRALRRVGFAAWLRTPDHDDWPVHLHGIAISDSGMHLAAATQVGLYHADSNGRAGNLPDDGPAVPFATWEDYQRRTSPAP